MNNKKVFPLIFLLCFLSLSEASASESTYHVTLGLKSWFSKYAINNSAEFMDGRTSNFGLILGPSLSVRKQRWRLGGNYSTGKYTFESFSFPDSNNGTQFTKNVTTLEVDRTDWEVYLGYQIMPKLSLLLGYKRLNYDYNVDLVTTLEPTKVLPFSIDRNTDTMLLGISGFYIIKNSWWAETFGNRSAIAGYATLAALYADNQRTDKDELNKTSNTVNTEMWGASIEMGLTNSWGSGKITTQLGAKYHIFKDLDLTEESDAFFGIAFSLNYTL